MTSDLVFREPGQIFKAAPEFVAFQGERITFILRRSEIKTIEYIGGETIKIVELSPNTQSRFLDFASKEEAKRVLREVQDVLTK